MDKIYFDYASTTPTDPRVLSAMLPYFTEQFGNASSPHSLGLQAQKALEDSREVLAKFIGAQRDEIVFTSGGTEANNLALLGLARALKSRGRHIIVTQVEHPSILETAQFLQSEGFDVTFVKVDELGQVNPEDIRQAMSEQTIVVSVLHANNEIGTIQPIAEIGKICRSHNVYFHVDAVQTVGHIPVDVRNLNIDLLSLSAHKFYGPKGIGALYVRRGIKLVPLLIGGNQEQGRRASTQNVAAAVGLAQALKLCQEHMAQEVIEQTRLRDALVGAVLKQVDGAVCNGHSSLRLPNNCHFAFSKISGESLLMSLDMVGICASMGSACKAGAMEVSHVLRAIRLSDEYSHGALRISLGRWTTLKHVDYLIEQLPQVVKQLRV